MIITIEPGIYLPGKFGIRIEDDVLITGKGRRVLSRLRKQVDEVRLPARR
jgi:Xaa-Pro aminopeptidase